MHISDDVQSIFKNSYQVPFAIRNRIKAELEAVIEKGLFTPVKLSEWAGQQVTVD